MENSGQRYVAATRADPENGVRRQERRDRRRRIATYGVIAVLLFLGVIAAGAAFDLPALFGSAAPSGSLLEDGSGADDPAGPHAEETSPASPEEGSQAAGERAGGGESGDAPEGGSAASGGPADERAPLNRALTAKGIYLTMDSAGTPSTMASLVTFMRQHDGLNSMVIDIKDNAGRVPTEPPETIPALPGHYRHIPALVRVLSEDEGYYMIARIVAFQDPYRAKTAPERAIRNADGTLWRDRDGRLWLNPYDTENWEYIRDIALWAAELGFDEIQLDYVRFPDSARGLEKTGAVLMPGADEFESRLDAIVSFLKYMDEALDRKAYLSADIFGFVTIASDDMGIGQRLEEIADVVDFISPMVYPSHYYNPGIYGFRLPEEHPYEVVFRAMDEATERTQGLRSRIRPWLQDFSMKVRYGPAEVQSQVQAVFEHDVETFMLWNPANVYTDGVKYTP